jgi:hypothetical protein
VDIAVPKAWCVLVEGIRDKQTVGITGSAAPTSARSPIVGIKGASCGPFDMHKLGGVLCRDREPFQCRINSHCLTDSRSTAASTEENSAEMSEVIGRRPAYCGCFIAVEMVAAGG